MQSIYAFNQCKQSNYYLAMDLVKDNFARDLNSMEVQDMDNLNTEKKIAVELFQHNYKSNLMVETENSSDKIRSTVIEAKDYYFRQVKKDLELISKNMIAEVEKLEERYLLILLLVVEFADQVATELEEKKTKINPKNRTTFSGELNFLNNKVVGRFRDDKALQIRSIKNKINWRDEKDEVRQWYKEILKKDADYIAYKNLSVTSFEEDRKIVNYIVKNIIFKNDVLRAYFEEKDLNWEENKSIIKSMVVKTIKSIDESTADGGIELMELSPNWEDDKEFFKEIFSSTIKNDDSYEEIIAEKAKNWDIERIAAIDKIILKMALNEFINSSSIPVKVTINEYIEISKDYSTPKSRQFINGILDVVATELQNEGMIRKSGRGLIDNK